VVVAVAVQLLVTPVPAAQAVVAVMVRPPAQQLSQDKQIPEQVSMQDLPANQQQADMQPVAAAPHKLGVQTDPAAAATVYDILEHFTVVVVVA
jgi:hypothetical protein